MPFSDERDGKGATDEPMRFAHLLAAAAFEVLADAQPVAAILHGSLATGDFVPGHSDIDLLAVVERSLSRDESDALIEAARHATREGQFLDLRVVTRAVAESPVPSPLMELYFGHHLHEPDEVERGVRGEPDLAVEFLVARSQGRSLLGPDPDDVIGSVSPSWVLDYGLRLLERWEGLTDDAPHAELMVLIACRCWHFADTLRLASKDAAASWALDRDPTLTAIETALQLRHGRTRASIPAEQVAAVLAEAKKATLAALAGKGGSAT
jgi:predicted nucleotidyltransferase